MPETQSSSSLVNQLRAFTDNDLDHDLQSRKAALQLAQKLTYTLNDPVNIATEMVFSPYIATAARIGVDLGLYELIATHGKPISGQELSTRSGGFVEEAGKDEWAATPVTHAMASPPVMAGHRFVWDILITSAVKSPQFLYESGYCCPTQPTDGFIQYAHQTKYNVFDYLVNEKPKRLKDFNNFMGNTMGARNYWIDWYPVEEKLLSDWDRSTTLLVDVAGGKGHDLQAFRHKYPDTKGKLVLQDLPQALDGIQKGGLDDDIPRQAQDFFEQNQVKGAKAYFLHHIIHDWSEEYALKILSRLKDAMTPDYSLLLIHELVLPDQGATTFQTVFDMTMMTFNSGMERNRSQWVELLDKAGFEVLKFWHGPDGEDADGIVEAKLKQ